MIDQAARIPAPFRFLRVLPANWLGSVVFSCLSLGIGSTLATAQNPQEFYQSLKARPTDDSGVTVVGTDAEKHVRFEPAGMRITLSPPKHHHLTGIHTGMRIPGDFEILVNYDILNEEPETDDPTKTATRIALLVNLDGPKRNSAGFARKVSAKSGPQFVAWTTLWNDEVGKIQTSGKEFTSDAKIGQLRLIRNGANLSFYAAEGADAPFKLLRQTPFTNGVVNGISVGANTGGRKGAIDVRLWDFRVRTEIDPLAAAAAPVDIAPPANPPFAQLSGGRRWVALGLILGLLLLASLGLGLWLAKRHRRLEV